MSPATSCPAAESFERLLRGDLPFAEVEQIARHVEECDRCVAAVQSLKAEDTLVEAMRSSATASDRPEKDVVLALANRLKELRSQATSPAVEDATATVPPREADAAVDDADVTGFLAPPQGPGEVGRLGNYRVVKVLGRGGMGVVFQAEDLRLGRTVALKAMLPETAAKAGMKERFLREARAAAAVEHDHIIPIYQVDEDRGVPYIAMPFLQGTSLEDWLQKRQTGPRDTPLTAPQVLKLGREIARGLAAAHARGLIHRDVKPANIWLDAAAGGRVKILDFGLARLTQSAGEQNLTQSGVIMGTPSYMAPEQARGEKVDGRTDLFSLGVVLYRLCTGAMPFTGTDTVSTLMAVVLDDPPAPHTVNPSVPRPLSDLVMKLLEKDPAKRFGSADEVVAALQALARPARAPAAVAVAPPAAAPENPWADLTETAAPAPPCRKAAPKAIPAPAPKRRLPRRRTLVVVGAAAALVVILGGVVLFWPTATGTVRIEVDDPAVKVAFDKDGPTITGADKDPITLKAGEHGILVTRGDFAFETDKFVLKKGETATLKITFLAGKVQVVKDSEPFAEKRVPQKPRPARAPKEFADPDREAAEWVLSIGGSITIRQDGQVRGIGAAKDLSAAPFAVVTVSLLNNPRADDAGLIHLSRLTDLTELNLHYTAVTDAGLVHLGGLTKLRVLDLGMGPGRITDAGVVHLKGLTNLTKLDLFRAQLTDAGLEQLKDLTNLTDLNLNTTRVTDAGLRAVKGMSKLTVLGLGGTQVTDAGLQQLKGLSNLTSLSLNAARISDAGLVHLKVIPNLTRLELDFTMVGDAGLGHLREMTKLTYLSLVFTQVTDAGLEHLKGLTNLTGLSLLATRVGDAGLMRLDGLTNLTSLNLDGTRVGDTGLRAAIKGMTKLTELHLNNTPVTDDGLRDLVHLPLGRIDLNNSRVSARGLATLRRAFPGRAVLGEPRPSLAEDFLAAGATLTIRVGEGQEDRPVKKPADLPPARFLVRRADCTGVKNGLAELLNRLSQPREYEFERLEALNVSGCPVDGLLRFAPPLASLQELDLSGTGGFASLQPLSGLKRLRKLSLDRMRPPSLGPVAGMGNLEELSLAGAQVADPALKGLENAPSLRKLDLTQTGVTGRGLGSLAKLPKLAELSLARSNVSDLFAAEVGALTKLERLSLAGCTFSDAGLQHLAGMSNLTHLDLTGTQVTPNGVAALQQALPKCKMVGEAARGTPPSPKEGK